MTTSALAMLRTACRQFLLQGKLMSDSQLSGTSVRLVRNAVEDHFYMSMSSRALAPCLAKSFSWWKLHR